MITILRYNPEGDVWARCAYCDVCLRAGDRVVQDGDIWLHDRCSSRVIAAGLKDLTRLQVSLPKAPDAEASILASCMVDEEACALVVLDLLVSDFWQQAHGIIFESIQDIHRNGHPVDLVSVAENLRSRDLLDDVGGGNTLVQLVDDLVTAAHAEEYVRLVVEASTKRTMLKAASDIKANGVGVDEIYGQLGGAFRQARDRWKSVCRLLAPSS
jgi:hypothetical protein